MNPVLVEQLVDGLNSILAEAHGDEQEIRKFGRKLLTHLASIDKKLDDIYAEISIPHGVIGP